MREGSSVMSVVSDAWLSASACRCARCPSSSSASSARSLSRSRDEPSARRDCSLNICARGGAIPQTVCARAWRQTVPPRRGEGSRAD
eukprot:3082963-Prymnesium_polylepis.1